MYGVVLSSVSGSRAGRREEATGFSREGGGECGPDYKGGGER